jgi:hypothetical protein
MPKSIHPREIANFTDAIALTLKKNDPASVLKALLNFGEYLYKKYPDMNNEEIQKALTKSHITFKRHYLTVNTLTNLGAMTGIATNYYSDRDDKCEEMLAKGDDSLFGIYKAWKIGAVVFAYFIGDDVKGDLFADLKNEVKVKTREWNKEVCSVADKIVDDLILDRAKKQDTMNKLEAICIQYQKLMIIDLKKSVLQLSQKDLDLFLDKKGSINIDKILSSPMHKYPELQKAKKRYFAITKLRETLSDHKISPSERLDHFNLLIKNPKIISVFTNNSTGTTLWKAFLSLIRAVRVTGVAGFFHSSQKRKAKTEFMRKVIEPAKRTRISH